LVFLHIGLLAIQTIKALQQEFPILQNTDSFHRWSMPVAKQLLRGHGIVATTKARRKIPRRDTL
jgi:hypothetical protein